VVDVLILGPAVLIKCNSLYWEADNLAE